jgi:5-methylcytosine-specific restriction endonuclease McrA
MLKRETNCGFVYKDEGFFKKKRLFGFRAGKHSTNFYMEENQYRSLLELQLQHPVSVMNDPASKKKWWMYKNEFWWEDDGCSSTDVQFLITDKLEQKKRQVAKAIARVSQTKVIPANERRPIPDNVKLLVWQRDGGRCAKCGSQEKLEYDHIIPLAKGGSNTARNIQLLCENCNRSKGANLF